MNVSVAVETDPHFCGRVLPNHLGLRAQADPGSNPCVTLSQAFDLPVPQFPQKLKGHNELGGVAIVKWHLAGGPYPV